MSLKLDFDEFHQLVEKRKFKTFFLESVNYFENLTLDFIIRPCTEQYENILSSSTAFSLEEGLFTSFDFKKEFKTLEEIIVEFSLLFGIDIDFYIEIESDSSQNVKSQKVVDLHTNKELMQYRV